MPSGESLKRYLRPLWRVAAVALVIGVVFAGWQGLRVWLAWRSVDRIGLDLDDSRSALATLPPPPPSVEEEADATELSTQVTAPGAPQDVLDDDAVDVYVVVGTDGDKLAGIEDDGFVTGEATASGEPAGDADAILLFLRPGEGRDPMLVSLPRDLLLVSPCTRRPTRLVTTLEGCGEAASGPELLALVIEDYTTLSVDHFAILSFGAFTQLIDRVGGIQVCVGVESRFDDLTLDAGCNILDGVDALQWIRSRTHFERVGDEWQAASGGDEARSTRQQELLVELLRRLKRFQSPLELAGLVEDLSDAVALDDGLSIPEAVDIAWEMRSIAPDAIQRPSLPIESRTLRGKLVWVPTQPFPDLLASVYAGDG